MPKEKKLVTVADAYSGRCLNITLETGYIQSQLDFVRRSVDGLGFSDLWIASHYVSFSKSWRLSLRIISKLIVKLAYVACIVLKGELNIGNKKKSLSFRIAPPRAANEPPNIVITTFNNDFSCI